MQAWRRIWLGQPTLTALQPRRRAFKQARLPGVRAARALKHFGCGPVTRQNRPTWLQALHPKGVQAAGQLNSSPLAALSSPLERRPCLLLAGLSWSVLFPFGFCRSPPSVLLARRRQKPSAIGALLSPWWGLRPVVTSLWQAAGHHVNARVAPGSPPELVS